MNSQDIEATNFDRFVEHLQCVPPHLHPRQILFLSSDIVGSTALKQAAGTSIKQLDGSANDISLVDFDSYPDSTKDVSLPDGELWFSVIQGFYVATVKTFAEKFKRAKAKVTVARRVQKFGDEPILWKTIGDEILFRKIITDHTQVVSTLACWIDAMSEVRNFLKVHEKKLDIKCTAWLAEFPVQNKLVIGPRGEFADSMEADDMETIGDFIGKYESDPDSYPGTRIDFVGPAIDIGFRLSSVSTNRKFVISLDVAKCIAEANTSELRIFYDGRHYLKGVMGGIEYPVFWIDMSCGNVLDEYEDKLAKKESCSPSTVKSFCDSFYTDQANPTYRPFIISDSDTDMQMPPPKYYKPYKIISDRYTSKDLALCPIPSPE